jgi:hypothetical protein
MTERELLTRFLDYIYYINDKSTQYTAISAFLEEGKPGKGQREETENQPSEQAVCSRCGRYSCEENEK